MASSRRLPIHDAPARNGVVRQLFVAQGEGGPDPVGRTRVTFHIALRTTGNRLAP